MNMKKAIGIILAIGIAVRIFLSLSTYHADVAALGFAGKVISEGNVANFYDYLANLPPDDIYLKVYPKDLLIYPPPIYFVHSLVSFLSTSIFGSPFIDQFITNFSSTLGDMRLNIYLLLLKLPYFFFDIAAAFLIMKIFSDNKKKVWSFALWIFNPVTLYATYMMGQFDIIPTFFVIAALVSAVKSKKIYLAAIFLGIGMSFKIYPFLFLIPLALTQERWIERIKVMVVGILPYLLLVFPYIFSVGFRSSALIAGLTTKSMYAAVPVSGGESIIIYLAAVLFFYIIFLFSENSLENLWQKFLIILVLFFTFTHYHPQWFTWITPFIIFDLVKSNFKRLPVALIVLVSWLGLVTFFDAGLTTRIFAPLAPGLWNLPDFWQVMGINFDVNLARSYLQTIFAACGLYYIYYYFPKKGNSAS